MGRVVQRVDGECLAEKDVESAHGSISTCMAVYGEFRLFRDVFALLLDLAKKERNVIGSYWEKGNQNEIDLVAVNNMKTLLTVAEIKMNKVRINLELKLFSEVFHCL
jgi:hypothetical protein